MVVVDKREEKTKNAQESNDDDVNAKIIGQNDDTNHGSNSEKEDKKNVSTSVDVDLDDFRNTVRSNILKRIYEKGGKLPPLKPSVSLQSSNDKDEKLSTTVRSNEFKVQNEKSSSSNLKQLTKNLLHNSDEWRKTLERIVKYDPTGAALQSSDRDTLDGGGGGGGGSCQLSLVTRKEALAFFLCKEFPPDPETKGEDEDEEKEKKNRRNRKVKKSSQSSQKITHIIQKPSSQTFQDISVEDMVMRKRKLPWKEIINQSKGSMMVNDILVHNNTDPTSSQETELLAKQNENLLQPPETMYDRYLVTPDHNFGENYFLQTRHLFKRNNRSWAVRLFVKLYEWILAQRSSMMVMNSSSSSSVSMLPISSTSTSNSTVLNNNRLVLELTNVTLNIVPHFSITDNDAQRLVAQLFTAYRRYSQTIEQHRSNRILIQLDTVIERLANEMENIDTDTSTSSSNMKDLESFLCLIDRLLSTRHQLIAKRRKTLIELLKIWDKVISDRSTNQLVTNNKLNLVLDEDGTVQESDEQMVLEQEISKITRWKEIRLNVAKKVTKVGDDDYYEVDLNRIKNETYLTDGRLPGEPKFSKIEYTFEHTLNNVERNTGEIFFYTAQILIGNQVVANLEPIEADLWQCCGKELRWNKVYSIPMPINTIPVATIHHHHERVLPSSSNDDLMTNYGPIVPFVKSTGGKTNDDELTNIDIQESTFEEEPNFIPKLTIFLQHTKTSKSSTSSGKTSLRKSITSKESSSSSSSTRTTIPLWSGSLGGLPRLSQRSSTNARIFEKEFELDLTNHNRMDETTATLLEATTTTRTRKQKKNKLKQQQSIQGSIRLSMHWSAVPNETILSAKNLDELFDDEKQQIKRRMRTTKTIDQALFDLRFLDTISLDRFLDRIGVSSSGTVEDESQTINLGMRKIQLMDLLLQQKYQLELGHHLDRQNLGQSKLTAELPPNEQPEQTNTSTETIGNQTLPDGIICTADTLERDRRFQLMIYRNQLQRGQRYYSSSLLLRNSIQSNALCFIPLEHVTEVMLNTVLGGDQSAEKASVDTLLRYVRNTCVQHERRIKGIHNLMMHQQRKKKKRKSRQKSKRDKQQQGGGGSQKEEEEEEINDSIVDNKICHEWCHSVATNEKTSTKSKSTIMLQPTQWIATVEEVLNQLEHRQQQSQQSTTDAENADKSSGGGGGRSGAGAGFGTRVWTRESIIKEYQMEPLNGANFSLFSWLFAAATAGSDSTTLFGNRKLNPSRKDRSKIAISMTEALQREVQVMLTVQHATNVPFRLESRERIGVGESDDDDDDYDDDEWMNPCCTYVEIDCSNHSSNSSFSTTTKRLRSSIAEGTQPTWNEHFRFNVRLDAQSLLTLNLFEVFKSYHHHHHRGRGRHHRYRSSTTTDSGVSDQQKRRSRSRHRHRRRRSSSISRSSRSSRSSSEDDEEDEESTTVTTSIGTDHRSLLSNGGGSSSSSLINIGGTKVEKRWFGQLQVSLLSLLLNSTIQGTFALKSPYFMQGYKSLNVKRYRLRRLEGDIIQSGGVGSGTSSLEKASQSQLNPSGRMLSTVIQAQQSLLHTDDTDDHCLLGSLPDIGLAIFLTVDPPIVDLSSSSSSSLLSDARRREIITTTTTNQLESSELLEHCTRWMATLANQYPTRRYICLVRNLQHHFLLACRFVAPIKPPELSQLIRLDQLTQSQHQSKSSSSSSASGRSLPKSFSIKKLVHKESLYLHMIIRYVSLIPSYGMHSSSTTTALSFNSCDSDYVNDSTTIGASGVIGDGNNNFTNTWWWRQIGGSANQPNNSSPIWFDVLQFLSFRVGFQVEHALYLAGMLQHLKRNAFLVFGCSLLEGPVGQVILFPMSATTTTTTIGGASGGLTSSSPSIIASKAEQADMMMMMMVNDQYEPLIIDPKSGTQYSVRDSEITLQSIDCIITNDNVYANIQKSSHPNSMQYNLNKSNHWQALFNSAKEMATFVGLQNQQQQQQSLSTNLLELDSSQPPLSPPPPSTFVTIQPETLSYTDSIHYGETKHLESKLEQYLREQLMLWRRMQSASFTAFNRYCTQIVRRFLPQLELHACLRSSGGGGGGGLVGTSLATSQHLIEEQLLTELTEITTVHRVVGYPLHVSPFISFEQCAKLVHSTGIHLIDTEQEQQELGQLGQHDRQSTINNGSSGNPTTTTPTTTVEYVVSVHVHTYPANVHSIWIYVAALVPNTGIN